MPDPRPSGPNPPASRSPWGLRLLFRQLALWLILYAALVVAHNATYDRTKGVLIHRLQVVPATRILALTLPGIPLVHTTTAIHSPHLELKILMGCDGVEAWLLMTTAILAFPMSWRRRGLGLIYGTVLVFGLNQARIVTLFHVALKKPEWMEIAHSMVWQSIMVLAIAAFVLGWMTPRRGGPHAPEGNP